MTWQVLPPACVPQSSTSEQGGMIRSPPFSTAFPAPHRGGALALQFTSAARFWSAPARPPANLHCSPPPPRCSGAFGASAATAAGPAPPASALPKRRSTAALQNAVARVGLVLVARVVFLLVTKLRASSCRMAGEAVLRGRGEDDAVWGQVRELHPPRPRKAKAGEALSSARS